MTRTDPRLNAIALILAFVAVVSGDSVAPKGIIDWYQDCRTGGSIGKFYNLSVDGCGNPCNLKPGTYYNASLNMTPKNNTNFIAVNVTANPAWSGATGLTQRLVYEKFNAVFVNNKTYTIKFPMRILHNTTQIKNGTYQVRIEVASNATQLEVCKQFKVHVNSSGFLTFSFGLLFLQQALVRFGERLQFW